MQNIFKTNKKPMKVDHIFDRGSGKTNEDVVLIEEHFFGVFDGASSLTGYLSPKEKTGGYPIERQGRLSIILSNSQDKLDSLSKNHSCQ